MAIKRWNGSTSQWELVGTPGTATPDAIGAAKITSNTFSGLQIVATASEWPIISRNTGPTSTNRNHLLMQRSNNNSAVTSGFTLGGISMAGHDGTNYGLGWNGGAEITAYASQNWTPSNRGTELTFSSTPNNSTTTLERMRIQQSGDVLLTNQPIDTLRFFDIYNTSSGNSAGTIIRFITNNAANTAVTTVDLVKYRNGYFGILNNDSAATIGFGTAGTERMRIINTGAVVIGHTSALNNEAFGVRTGANVQNIWSDSIDPNYSTVAFGNRITRANTSAYTFLQNWSGGGSDTEHYLRGDGQAFADGSWNGGGADYAEYFEWADGNINNEDRRGYSVSLINDKIKIAEEGETVFGVVSGNPSVVGDDAPMKWAGKYLKDDFGSYIRDEDGYRVLNPEYDEEAEYVSRESRPEWSTIGLMGKLRLRKGQIVSPSWIKMKDISAEVEEWLVK
jgi:hypothetical protein